MKLGSLLYWTAFEKKYCKKITETKGIARNIPRGLWISGGVRIEFDLIFLQFMAVTVKYSFAVLNP